MTSVKKHLSPNYLTGPISYRVFRETAPGPVGGTNFVFCSYGKFNSGYRDEKCLKFPENTRGTAFRLVSDLTNHAQLKMFHPGKSRYPERECSYGKNFQLGYRDLDRDLGNRASPPSHII